MISILHPSRNRPNRSAETLKKWIFRAENKEHLEIIISVDMDDKYYDDYRCFGDSINARILCDHNRSAVDAINHAAKHARGDIFIVVSDDTDCPEHWDKMILDAVAGKTDWVLKCNDGGIQNWIITMPVMDRTFYNRFGYVYFPEYIHMFCDTELAAVADLTGRRIQRDDLVFPHIHAANGTGVDDELNIRANASWDQGKALFLKRSKENWGVKDPVGQITDVGYLNWMAEELKTQPA